MQLTDLIAKVCAYLNRTHADLIVNGIDLVTVAANDAKRWAQQVLDFEKLRCTVRLTIPAGRSANLSDATYLSPEGGASTTAQPIGINRIERAYVMRTTTQGSEVQTSGMQPIEFRTRNEIARRDQRYYDQFVAQAILSQSDVPEYRSRWPVVVRQANQVYLWPKQDTDTVIALDIIEQLGNYSPVNPLAMFEGSSGVYGTSSQFSVTLTTDPVVADEGPVQQNRIYYFYEVGTAFGQPLYRCQPDETFPTAILLYYNPANLRWEIGTQLYNATVPLEWILSESGVEALYGNFTWTANGFYTLGENYTLTVTPQNNTNISGDDFFLEDCSDWLSLRVMKALSYLLKTDERYVVSQKQVDEAWGGVVAWNNSIADSGSGQEYDLD